MLGIYTTYKESILFLLSINLIKGDTPHYRIYVVLIQDIKDKLVCNNFSVYHTLREGN